MSKRISTDLPFRYRVDINLVKRRDTSRGEESIIPSIKKIARIKNGNKISRFFRHIFEHKHASRFLGSNIALLAMATSFMPTVSSNQTVLAEQTIITTTDINIKTEKHIQYPLGKIQLNQGYSFFHPGLDFEGLTGEAVLPIMAGEVEMVQYSNFAYGNAVIIRHGDNYSSLYAHLSKIYVEKGQKVDLKTIIGEVGSTGRSSGDHLHLEIRENGRQINPLSMLPKR